ncbi:MAG: tetratricopeptide repeat protein [Opitutaceae bacterium]
MNLRKRLSLLFALVPSLTPVLASQEKSFDYEAWVFPEYSWKEEDFQNRFLGRFGVNGYTEPQMDVENYYFYEGAMALIEDRPAAIGYLRSGMDVLDESGIEASAALHFVLGSLLYDEGDMPSAIEQYALAIRKHPSFLRAYANLGFTLMEAGESEKALPVLLKAVELGANESQIWGLIGRIYTGKELYKSGLTAYRNATVFNPENNAWRFGILQCLIALDRFDEAITMADEVLAFDRRNPANWVNRAGLLIHLERSDEAIVDLQVAHELGGMTFDSCISMAILQFNKGIYEEVAGTLAEAADRARNTDEFDRWLDITEALAHAGQSGRAFDLLPAIARRAVNLEVKLDSSKINRIRVLHDLEIEAYGEALATLESLIDLDPVDGELHLEKARALIGLERPEEAAIAFQIAATFEETAYRANYEYARMEFTRGDISGGLRLLRSAYAINPSEALRSYIRELESHEENP